MAKLGGRGAPVKMEGNVVLQCRAETSKLDLVTIVRWCGVTIALGALLAAPAPAQSPASGGTFTMEQVLDYPFVPELDAAQKGDAIAFVRVLRGVRNIWAADGPDLRPRQVTQYSSDDGQEITQLTFSPDGKHLVYVRGGDHDANWEAKLPPDPSSSPVEPKVTIWAAQLSGGAPVKVAEGDGPAISARGELAYVKDNQVWTAQLDGKGKPRRLFFDRGEDGALTWSPDGGKLAFVSNRDGDHSFIGVYELKTKSLTYLAPSTDLDDYPVWSPDGTRVAFARQHNKGGPPKPLLKQTPNPFSIWVADVASGRASRTWQSPDTLHGSFPQTAGEINLNWAAGDRLVFLADLDNWPHLYSIPAGGGEPLLLTPGNFMVEHVAISRDHKFLIYDANTGTTKDDGDRRHLFRVPVDSAEPVALTNGTKLEWSPVVASGTEVAFIGAGFEAPPSVSAVEMDGSGLRDLGSGAVPRDFPQAEFLTPSAVRFTAADGWTIHGQLFDNGRGTRKPGIIFVHGGPPRQMLLGWHYMDYYSNSYAVNQYFANHGYVVLSVNYRLGIGYGHDFHHPDHSGPAGAAEYQDVVAGAKYLQALADVDPAKIGIWGGSYGGYLTAMGLARNSDIFKAGVDMHGVHDWSALVGTRLEKQPKRYEKGDIEEAMKVAFESSPIATMNGWSSPVLLIQGDDDRNVNFAQTIDLARRLEDGHVPFQQLVIPNEIHGFLRWQSWLVADTAAADFFARVLPAAQ
ncbi:MAG TPA: prolyl oligopeptidase family serine peptidase [Sphingomicrobium sp.]|nr:prolyl oligopeptidase family serine peptidase [Sphingomicrobium sp.]